MYNVFDYMNVQNIHNATFRDVVSDGGKSDYIMVSSRSRSSSLLFSLLTESLPDATHRETADT
jgi:hypothetical protein